jgi:hypothetical protein
VTPGRILTIPSTTLVFTPFGAVITTSYNERPGVRFDVFAADREMVISPFEAAETNASKLIDELV